MFYFCIGLITGILIHTIDFDSIRNKCNQLLDLYFTIYEKQDQSQPLLKKHSTTFAQVGNFLFTAFLQQMLKNLRFNKDVIVLNKGEKILYPVYVGHKIKYVPYSSAAMQTPDILNMSFERSNNLVTDEWIDSHIVSILSVFSDYKEVTPSDFGLKTLSFEVLDGIDIKKFTFEENQSIKIT